jgi:serine/threonine protein kinase
MNLDLLACNSLTVPGHGALPSLDKEEKSRPVSAQPGTSCSGRAVDVSKRKILLQKGKSKSLPLPTIKLTKPKVEEHYNINEHYELGAQLGVGTYGEVRQAQCKTTLQQVAVKICRGRTAIQMLSKEAEILKELDDE